MTTVITCDFRVLQTLKSFEWVIEFTKHTTSFKNSPSFPQDLDSIKDKIKFTFLQVTVKKGLYEIKMETLRSDD